MKLPANRFLILALLDVGGPLHGHAIRQEAQLIKVAAWGEVKVGALYATLHQLEKEGRIKQIGQSREGNRPTRTTYRITATGRTELRRLRLGALNESGLRSDPIDMVIASWVNAPKAVVRLALARRETDLKVFLKRLARYHESAATTGQPWVAMAVIRHWEIRARAELAWHRELEAIIR